MNYNNIFYEISKFINCLNTQLYKKIKSTCVSEIICDFYVIKFGKGLENLFKKSDLDNYNFEDVFIS